MIDYYYDLLYQIHSFVRDVSSWIPILPWALFFIFMIFIFFQNIKKNEQPRNIVNRIDNINDLDLMQCFLGYFQSKFEECLVSDVITLSSDCTSLDYSFRINVLYKGEIYYSFHKTGRRFYCILGEYGHFVRHIEIPVRYGDDPVLTIYKNVEICILERLFNHSKSPA